MRHIALLTVLCFSGAVASPATAFAPVPVPASFHPQTAWLFNPLARSTAVVSEAPPAVFVARHSGVWTWRRFGPTGDFRRLLGSGVPVDPRAVVDRALALTEATRFWRENPELLPSGVAPEDLAPVSNTRLGAVRLIGFEQRDHGVPVIGSGCFVAISHGRIVMVGVRAFALAARPAGLRRAAAPSVSMATKAVLAALMSRGEQARLTSSRLVALPLVTAGQVTELRLVQEVVARRPGATWRAFAGADGALLALEDQRLPWDGMLQLTHHDRNLEQGLIIDPASHLDLEADGAVVRTAADGSFATAQPPTAIDARLVGPYIEVVNLAGFVLDSEVGPPYTAHFDGAVLGASGAALTLISDGTESQQAELDAYHYITAVRAHAQAIVPGQMPWLDQLLVANVNAIWDLGGDGEGDFCNAWYDGEAINFLPSGSYGPSFTCNNTAMIGDIVFHEYGHAVHEHAVLPGVGTFDVATSEGFADTMSASMTHDSRIAPYFGNGPYAMRDVADDFVWPDDLSADPHATGQIVSGALWDLRVALVAELGDAAGHALADQLFGAAMRTASDVPSLWDSLLLADDDNGDLADGTPHYCQLYDALAPHGLAPGGTNRVQIDFTPVGSALAPDRAFEVVANVGVRDGRCSTLGGVRLVYSTDRGQSWTTVLMTHGDGAQFRAALPALPTASEVYYRVEADETSTQATSSRPDNRGEPFYRAFVGRLYEIACDDFENPSDGWTHGLLPRDDGNSGTDDWMRNICRGGLRDPQNATSGKYVWGTNLHHDDEDEGNYAPLTSSELVSPAFDLSAYRTVRLAFRRWLSVEDGYFDHALVVAGDQEAWSNAASPGGDTDPHDQHTIDKEWIPFSVDVSAATAGQSAVQFRFQLESDPGLQLGGWAIDDFCLYTADFPEQLEPDGGALETPDGGGVAIAGDNADTLHAASGGCSCRLAGRQTAGAGGGFFALLASLAI